MSEHDARGIDQPADPATWHSEAGARGEGPGASPELGAFSATVTVQGQVSGQPFTWGPAAATFTPSGSEARRSLSGVGPFVIGAAPPPPPPTLQSVTPNPVASGGLLALTGTGYDPSAVVLFNGQKLVGQSLLAPTRLTVLAPVSVAQDQLGALLVETAAGISGPQMLTVRAKTAPPPPDVISVMSKGATGNGTTDDRAAIQAAIDAAIPGQTVFFPAGKYLIKDSVKLYNKDNIAFLGEGSNSILYHPSGNGLVLSNGNALTGITVRKLHFMGADHWIDGAPTGTGVFLFGTLGTIIEDCDFTWPQFCVYDAGDGDPASHGSTKGTQILSCRTHGWGTVALFLNGGNIVRGCSLSQQSPYELHKGSHGIYVHSGASDVLIEDNLIEGVAKYCCQLYGEQVGTVSKNFTFRRNTIKHCYNGIVLGHSQPGAADVDGALIEDNTFDGITEGNAINVRTGKSVVVRNNKITNVRPGAGIAFGLWAPWQPPEVMGPVLLEGNTVSNSWRGIWIVESNGSKFQDCVIQNNDFSQGNSRDIDAENWNGVPPNVTLTNNKGRTPMIIPGEAAGTEAYLDAREWQPG